MTKATDRKDDRKDDKKDKIKEYRKGKIKEMLKQLHAGAKPDDMKEKFKEILKDVDAAEIAQIEDELIKEGIPHERLQKLCDVHIAVFRERLEKEKPLAAPGHPIHTLMEEHKLLLGYAGELKKTAGELKPLKDCNAAGKKLEHLNHLAEHFRESEKHYLREENVLFSHIEQHGITQPPAIMWSEHDKIRLIEKNYYRLIGNYKNMAFKDFTKYLNDVAVSLADTLANHFYKENNVLFPTALKVVTQDEWAEVRKEFDEIGYCCFTPDSAKAPATQAAKPAQASAPAVAIDGGKVQFETGSFTVEELQAVLDTMPVDITFVDKDDTVRYFSNSKDRIFPRTKGIIGRKVQNCHPQKSLAKVENIVQGFKDKKLDKAEFWINLKGMLIYIRYFPVRDAKGEYMGVLEVSQDIAPLKKIEGEKRLL